MHKSGFYEQHISLLTKIINNTPEKYTSIYMNRRKYVTNSKRIKKVVKQHTFYLT